MKDRTPLPKLKARSQPAIAPVSIAQAPWLEADNLPVHEQWLPIVWRLEGPLDVRAFLAAFQDLIQRHQILRTVYQSDGKAWRQALRPVGEVRLRPIDMTDADPAHREFLIWERLRVIYDMTVTPEHGAVRLEFFRVGAREYLLAGFVHHIAIDNASIGIFFSELMDSYLRRVSGADPAPPPKLQYADFTLWESEWLKSGGAAEAAKYWKKALASAAPFSLPGGRGRRGPRAVAIGQEFRIEPQVFAALKNSGADLRATVPVMFYAAIGIALARWAKRDQVLFGAFAHGRPPGFGEVMGCFTQLRPFFLDLGGNPRLKTVLERAREAAIAVSDFRRPVEGKVMSTLGVGNVLVNYVRSSAKHDAVAPVEESMPDSAMKEPVVGAGQDELRQAETISVSRSELDAHRDDVGPWRREPAFSGSASLNALSKNQPRAREFGVRSGMSRLPRLLQPYFSRDLHVGVVESKEGLSVRLTTAEGGLDPSRAATMMSDIPAFLTMFASGVDRRVSALLR